MPSNPVVQCDRDRFRPLTVWRIVGAVLMCAALVAATRAYGACATNVGGQSLPTSQFTINPDETVNDGVTGLMWRRCVQGSSGANCAVGSPVAAQWSGALLAAKSSNFAGYSDWRLPSKAELESLVDDTCAVPATNAAVFPNSGDWLITSTTAAAFNGDMNGDSVWLVDFANGDSAQSFKLFGNVATYVRLVRGGQFDALAPPCNLDINDDGSVSAAKDGVLLLRYLLGFRGAALIADVAIGPARGGAAGVESLIGTATKYDVFGRPAPIVTALSDGLVLTRLMSGLPDIALLNGVPLPAGATHISAAAVRGAVNTRCGTSF
jgi:hypothetical protein